MTGIEVIDTAVKIGLGAVITGVASYFIAKSNQKHEVDREHLRRARDTLETVSEELEKVHKYSVELYAAASVFLNKPPGTHPPPQDDESLVTQAIDTARILHRLESRLLLLGLKGAESVMRDYLGAMRAFQKIAHAPQPGSHQKLDKHSDHVGNLRAKLYELQTSKGVLRTHS